MQQDYSVTHGQKKKGDLQLVYTINENLICLPTIFLKLIFTFKFGNMTIILTITVCIPNNVDEIDGGTNKHICKNIFTCLSLFH